MADSERTPPHRLPRWRWGLPERPVFHCHNTTWMVWGPVALLPVGAVVVVAQRSGWEAPVRVVRHVADYVSVTRGRFVLCEFDRVHNTGDAWKMSGDCPE